jgi:hypothetical protein
MAALISVPAGRSVRRSQDSKWVDPLPEKGLIEMKLEDDLMHMCEWARVDRACSCVWLRQSARVARADGLQGGRAGRMVRLRM